MHACMDAWILALALPLALIKPDAYACQPAPCPPHRHRRRPAQEKKKKAGSLLVIAGTAAGDVKAYNTQLGELAWRSSNCIEG